MEKYKVERQSRTFQQVYYTGYIDGEYAGNVVGIPRNEKLFDILNTSLVPKFRGTKAVRAFKEITDAVLKDYANVITRIDSKDNKEIKIVLSAGFHIVGTKTYKDEISVEILKIREG